MLRKDYKRKAGEIVALRKEMREIAKIVLKKEQELRALDEILRSRDSEFSPSTIKPIATYPKVLGLKRSKLTTYIYQCLLEANGEPMTNIEITDYFIKASGIEIQDRETLLTTRLCVRKRLKGLAAAGKIIGLHEKTTNQRAIWVLPSSE